jgi:hypothetical protein
MRIGTLISAIAAVPSLATAAKPIRLAPSSQWVVDYAANSCRLIRHFGQDKDATIFALESEAPGAVDMLVAGKPLATSMEQVPARFLPVQVKPARGFVGETTDNHDPMVLWSTVRLLPDDAADAAEKREADRKAQPEIRPPAVSLAEQAARKAQRQAFAAKATALEIDARHGRPVILETGSLGEPIRMFDQCSRESLRDWGVDPDLEDKIVRPVWAPYPFKWFSANDYPQELVVLGQESDVKVRLLVDASGRVTKCTSLSHFKEPKFNQIVCDKFMKRASFEPAELADGTKVPSYYTNRVVFRISR